MNLIIRSGLTAAVIVSPCFVQAQYAFTDLDNGVFASSAASGCVPGQQVGFAFDGHAHGLLWTGTAASAIEMTPTSIASESEVAATDGTQQVGYIVRSNDPAAEPRAWIWNGAPESGQPLHPIGWFYSLAFGMGDGEQVGYGTPNVVTPEHPLLWHGDRFSFVDLTPPGFVGGRALCAKSGVQGGYAVDGSNRQHAGLWSGTASSFIDYDGPLAAAGYQGSYIRATNGTLHVGAAFDVNFKSHAIVLDNFGGFQDFHPAGYDDSAINEMNGDNAVGYADDLNGYPHAFLWSASTGTRTDLGQYLPPGYTYSSATGIDSDGNIVGIAFGDGLAVHACMWTPVVNHAPIANAGPDINMPVQHDGDPSSTTATITIDGSASSDPDAGQNLTYEWRNQNNVVVGTSAILIRGGVPVGVRTFTLKVTDPFGLTSTDTVQVTITPEQNQSPISNAGPDQNLTIPSGQSTINVVLDGTGSSDPDSDYVNYEWSEGGIIIGATSTMSISKGPGDYTFNLRVTDSYGVDSNDTVQVHINAASNNAPAANAGPDVIVGAAPNGTNISIAGSASDPDGDAVSVVWTENGTQIGTGATLNATLAAGIHVLVETVTDSHSASASDSVTVFVWYQWSNLQQPVNSDGSSIFKLGRTVPTKFILTGVSSGALTTAHLYVAKITNNILGTEEEAISTSAADSGNTFRYQDGQYMFNLSTSGLTTGTYQLRVDLGDGNLSHTVLISLK